jgi:hypothetical protein
MPSFPMLSHDQVNALYAYIRAGARAALAGQADVPTGAPPVNAAATPSNAIH